MSDELLRHLADNCGDLSRILVFDERTQKMKKALTGQAHRLLSVMCSHANTERICFVGRETLMHNAKLNGMSIDTATDNLISAQILLYLGRTSYFGSIPIKTYLIDFPGLQPIEDALTEKELKKKARSLKALKSAPKTSLESDLPNCLSGVSMLALNPALPVRHKQKQVTEIEYEHQQQQEWSHGCYESEPSEEERLEFLEFSDALEDPF